MQHSLSSVQWTSLAPLYSGPMTFGLPKASHQPPRMARSKQITMKTSNVFHQQSSPSRIIRVKFIHSGCSSCSLIPCFQFCLVATALIILHSWVKQSHLLLPHLKHELLLPLLVLLLLLRCCLLLRLMLCLLLGSSSLSQASRLSKLPSQFAATSHLHNSNRASSWCPRP